MKRLVTAAIAGANTALLPLVALAAEPTTKAAAEGRGVPPPADMGSTVLYTLLGLGGLFLVTGLGYLYRQQRNLNWSFQAPAVPHDDHHDGHQAAHAPAAASASAPHGSH